MRVCLARAAELCPMALEGLTCSCSHVRCGRSLTIGVFWKMDSRVWLASHSQYTTGTSQFYIFRYFLHTTYPKRSFVSCVITLKKEGLLVIKIFTFGIFWGCVHWEIKFIDQGKIDLTVVILQHVHFGKFTCDYQRCIQWQVQDCTIIQISFSFSAYLIWTNNYTVTL